MPEFSLEQIAEARQNLSGFLEAAQDPTDSYDQLIELLYGRVDVPEQVAIVIKGIGHLREVKLPDSTAEYIYRAPIDRQRGLRRVWGLAQDSIYDKTHVSLSTRWRTPIKNSLYVAMVAGNDPRLGLQSIRRSGGQMHDSLPEITSSEMIGFFRDTVGPGQLTSADGPVTGLEVAGQYSRQAVATNNEFRKVAHELVGLLLEHTGEPVPA